MHIGQNRLSCVGQLYFLSLSLPPSRIFLWRSVLRCIGNGGGTCFIQKYIHMSMHMYVHTDVDFRRCILHNWQGLMCITHKSIEILRHFFCTLVFLRHCVCVFRFVFFLSLSLSYICFVPSFAQRGNGYRCCDQGYVAVWLTKISRSFLHVCVHVCVRVPASVCRTIVRVCAGSGGCCFSCCAREEEGWGREVGSRQLLGVATKWNEFKMEIENVSRKRGSLCQHSTHSTWPWIYSHAGNDIYTHSNKLKKMCINRCLHEKFNSWREWSLYVCRGRECDGSKNSPCMEGKKEFVFVYTKNPFCRFNWGQP